MGQTVGAARWMWQWRRFCRGLVAPGFFAPVVGFGDFTGGTPVPGPPAHARKVQTGPDIGQWQETGTTITRLWMDLEAGMVVQVTGDSLDPDPSQGEISIDINQASGGGHIGRYRGGIYPTPRKVGPVTLTGVTGSLATRNMVISFSYADGTGKLVPRTGHVTIVPRLAACAISHLRMRFIHQGATP